MIDIFKSFQHHNILTKLCLYTNLECITNLVTEAQYHNKNDIKEQAIFSACANGLCMPLYNKNQQMQLTMQYWQKKTRRVIFTSDLYSFMQRAMHALIQQKPTNAINYAILAKKN